MYERRIIVVELSSMLSHKLVNRVCVLLEIGKLGRECDEGPN